MESKIFPGTVESIDQIRQYIKEISELASLGKKPTYNLMLAADEIATNIVLYGYEKSGHDGDINVLHSLSEDELVVIFEDEAIPFNPLTRELPEEEDLLKPLEERAIGGLGIFLTINGVDEFAYEYVDNHNRNIFKMKLEKTG